jgi:DNA (cytosine-5)-methyltransferase 1
MKILNLYAGLGGNRKLWKDVDVTAVEINPDIAKIYQDFFPDDKVLVTDAHQYLLDHYKEFDFIWSSPPCPTHSRARFWGLGNGVTDPVYPDMKLYEEIIFLNHHYKGKWLVENVVPYYKPLIPATEMSRHLFWSNFYIQPYPARSTDIRDGKEGTWTELLGFDISSYKNIGRRDKILRNCVLPEIGLHIFKSMNNQELKLAI